MHSRTVAARSRSRLRVPALIVLTAVVAAIGGFLAGGRGDAAAAPAAASEEREARFWRQLTSVLQPGGERPLNLSSMSDHRLYILPSGLAFALHFDNMDLAKAENLNWVAVAIPGKFTRADQRRVNRLYGPGFTHFHSFKNDAHGGKAGTKGVWFVHVGARDFTSPFGKVRRGKVDLKFMPTRPPR